MNTRIKSLLILAITVVMLFVIGTASASTPISGEGNFYLMAAPVINSAKQANGNMFVDQTLVFGYDGTMVGESIADVTCLVKPDGTTICHGREVFSGSVEDQSGTYVFQVAVKVDETGQLKGQWIILDGTGELENLKGGGTVSGTTAAGSYTLDFHFDPN
jgi:hypothetical protein